MRIILHLLLLFTALNGFSQPVNSTDTLKKPKKTAVPFEINGTILFSSIGFSPVPSFSFDRPITTLSLSIIKKRFSYQPAASWGLDAKPWIIENWVKYRFLDRKRVTISAGINLSLFFKSERITNGEETIQANRNVTAGAFSNFKISKQWSASLTWWYNKRLDKGTLSGHFIDVAGFVNDIDITKKLFITAKPELFYFNNVGDVDGVFVSGTISVRHRVYPVSFYMQGVEPVWANFLHDGFKWSVGLGCSF